MNTIKKLKKDICYCLKKEEDIKIPDVSGMSVIDAESLLKNEGFKVKAETEKIESSKYDAGLVVKTDPIAERKVPKGTVITISINGILLPLAYVCA